MGSGFGTNSYIVNILRFCLHVTLQFLNLPPLVRQPIIMESNLTNLEKHSYLKLAVQELINKNVLEVVDHPKSPGFYVRLFLRPKLDGSWRKVIDLSGLNDYIVNQSFGMETVLGVQMSLERTCG